MGENNSEDSKCSCKNMVMAYGFTSISSYPICVLFGWAEGLNNAYGALWFLYTGVIGPALVVVMGIMESISPGQGHNVLLEGASHAV